VQQALMFLFLSGLLYMDENRCESSVRCA